MVVYIPTRTPEVAFGGPKFKGTLVHKFTGWGVGLNQKKREDHTRGMVWGKVGWGIKDFISLESEVGQKSG